MRTAVVGGSDCNAPWSTEAGGVGAGTGTGAGVFEAEVGVCEVDAGAFRRGTAFALGLKADFDLSMLRTWVGTDVQLGMEKCDLHDTPPATLVDLVRGD